MPFFTKATGEEKSRLQVRATLAFMFAVATIAGFFMGLVPYEAFNSLAVMAVSWYFATRNIEEKNGGIR